MFFALFFLKNSTANVDRAETIIKIITGVCLGFTSATCGAAIVTNLAKNVVTERLNGTNNGGKDSGLMLKINKNAPSKKNLQENTQAAII